MIDPHCCSNHWLPYQWCVAGAVVEPVLTGYNKLVIRLQAFEHFDLVTLLNTEFQLAAHGQAVIIDHKSGVAAL